MIPPTNGRVPPMSSAVHLNHPDPTVVQSLPRAGWSLATADGGLFAANSLELVDNDFSFRLSAIQGNAWDPRRDINDECGFPRSESYISPEFYQRLYERDALFARVIECIPKECWAVQPLVYSSDDPTKSTPFEESWDGLGKNLRGAFSRFREEEGSPIWSYLLRADVLSGIGRYGIILLGLDDGRPLSEPVEGVEEQFSVEEGGRLTDEKNEDGSSVIEPISRPDRIPGVYNMTINRVKTKGRKLVFLRVFPEVLAPVIRWEGNWTSPRFGQPTAYQVTFNDPFGTQQTMGTGLDTATREVHWTRVIHVVDSHHGVSPNEFMGVPRGQQVLNEVLSSQKLRWGGPEGYFKSCIPTTVISTHPSLGGNVKVNMGQMKDMVERVQNGMQKWMYLSGAGATNLGPQVVDNTPFLEWCIKVICIKLNIPVRIFMGSERGELASTQDEGDWSEERKARNRNHTIPNLIVPFVDRCIMVGVLADPGEPRLVAQEETTVLSPDAEGEAGATEVDDPVGGLGDPDAEQDEREDDEDKVPVGNAGPPAEDEEEEEGGDGKRPPFAGAGQPADEDDPSQEGRGGKLPNGLTPVGAPGKVKYKTEGGYVVEWPDIDVQTKKEKAETALVETQADAAYIAGDNGQLFAPMDYLTRTRGYSEEEAAAIIENSAAMKEQMRQEQLQQQAEEMDALEEQIDRGLVPDPNDPDLVPDAVGGGGPPGFGGPPKPGQPKGPPGGGKRPPFPPKPSTNRGSGS